MTTPPPRWAWGRATATWSSRSAPPASSARSPPRPSRDVSGTVAGFADATGRHLPLIATLNAARVLDAAGRLLGVDHAALSQLALEAAPGADGLVLVPYFEGERTPAPTSTESRTASPSTSARSVVATDTRRAVSAWAAMPTVEMMTRRPRSAPSAPNSAGGEDARGHHAEQVGGTVADHRGSTDEDEALGEGGPRLRLCHEHTLTSRGDRAVARQGARSSR